MVALAYAHEEKIIYININMKNIYRFCFALWCFCLPEATFAQAQRTPDEGVITKEGIRYSSADSAAQTLIISYHKNTDKLRPAVLHFHGGGFRKGSAEKGTAEWLANNGFVGISVNYRLSGQAIFPAAVHDCKTAVRWARAHAAQYGIDPQRIGVFGGSAGGHLAALTGMSAGDEYLEGDGPFGNFSSAVQVVSENYGPTDFLQMNSAPGHMDHDAPDSPESAFIGGPIQQHPDQVARANPIRYVDASDPPTQIIHGLKDMSVPYHQSELLYDALQKAGVESRLVPVENAGHGFKPDPKEETIKPTKDEIKEMHIEWLWKHLK
jgi:acetyl esterase/lipase